MLSRNLTVSTNVRTPPLVVSLYCPDGNPLNTQVTNTTNKARINKSVKYISISGNANGARAVINAIQVPLERTGVVLELPMGCLVPSNLYGPGINYSWSLPKKSLSEYGISSAEQYDVLIYHDLDKYGCRSVLNFKVYFHFY